jgi:uncharacterized protein YjbI with pentapeptide repeats
MVVWALWRIPQALYAYVPEAKDRASVEASTRTGMIAGLAGLAALGSLVLTSRTYRLTQQGQLSDRYTKAIAQLGDDKLDVRLGGIYALERIAVDSKRDHPTVVEVLSAFVRERSAPIQRVRPVNRRTAHPPIFRKQVKLGTEIQAALTVLGRLPRRAGVSRGDLRQANLTGASLHRANLTEAELGRTYLTKVNLFEANLTEANLGRADLTNAILAKANLIEAWFKEADLTGANLGGADLTGANLTEADLTGADLYRADLTGADLYQADLTGADLSKANLTSAKNLTQNQLDAAKGNEITQLPAGLRRPEGWRQGTGEPG